MTPSCMAHQERSLEFCQKKKIVADFSDPGTGKTCVQILDFARQHRKDGKACLVFAPKSILKPAWEHDIKKFAPHLTVSVATAQRRRQAVEAPVDVVITNIDAATDLEKYPPKTWQRFGRIIIDESTSIKNPKARRSKAVARLARHFEYRRIMSGTPVPQSILDLWHQIYVLDEGRRLSSSFYAFRAATCAPEQNGPSVQHVKWVDRPGIENIVMPLIEDLMIRHKFEDCVDIPENHQYEVETTLSPAHRKFYDEFETARLAEIRGKTISAVNAAALNVKLLQVASGACYDDGDGYSIIDRGRYGLVAELVLARRHSIVWYQWRHQLEELRQEFEKNQIPYKVWDPDHPEIATKFQAGRYQALLCHPQNAAHGLTLTRAASTILCSPTFNLEHYLQLMRRIYRVGQKQKTETIVIVAPGTRDEVAWARMLDKKVRQDDFFTSIEELRK